MKLTDELENDVLAAGVIKMIKEDASDSDDDLEVLKNETKLCEILEDPLIHIIESQEEHA